MNLEAQIKELEEKLAVKNAFLNVEINFKKEAKIPKKAQEEVSATLMKICKSYAEAQEQGASLLETSNKFSEEELDILKGIVERVKRNPSMSKPEPERVKSEAPAPPSAPLIEEAKIMLTENIDVTVRPKIEADAVVKIISRKKDKVFVETKDKKRLRFFIPIEDLEFVTSE